MGGGHSEIPTPFSGSYNWMGSTSEPTKKKAKVSSVISALLAHNILKESKARLRALISVWPRNVIKHREAISKSQ